MNKNKPVISSLYYDPMADKIIEIMKDKPEFIKPEFIKSWNALAILLFKLRVVEISWDT